MQGQLAVICAAKRVGLRINEIKQLFHGFRNGVPAFHRWHILTNPRAIIFAPQLAALE